MGRCGGAARARLTTIARPCHPCTHRPPARRTRTCKDPPSPAPAAATADEARARGSSSPPGSPTTWRRTGGTVERLTTCATRPPPAPPAPQAPALGRRRLRFETPEAAGADARPHPHPCPRIPTRRRAGETLSAAGAAARRQPVRWRPAGPRSSSRRTRPPPPARGLPPRAARPAPPAGRRTHRRGAPAAPLAAWGTGPARATCSPWRAAAPRRDARGRARRTGFWVEQGLEGGLAC